MPRGVYVRSKAVREAIGARQRGRILSEATRQKMSLAKMGKCPANHAAALAAAHAAPKLIGADNPSWKGDAVGYGALHRWVARHRGTPSRCEKCGSESAERYEWANPSRTYRRDLSEWARLCAPCHRTLDYVATGARVWNRGKKVRTNTGRTHIKAGQRISRATEFKPGLVPHNKYLELRDCLTCRRPFQPLDASRKYCCRACYWESLRKA